MLTRHPSNISENLDENLPSPQCCFFSTVSLNKFRIKVPVNFGILCYPLTSTSHSEKCDVRQQIPDIIK